MSWHPYRRNSHLWTIYWNEQTVAKTGAPETAQPMHLFELTEPYSMNREQWCDVQIWLLLHLTPPEYYLNISQLWYRSWPKDADLHYTRLNEVHKLPLLVSQECYQAEDLYRREGYYWLLSQFKPSQEILDNFVWHHGVDFENVSWITREPITPFPTQLFEFNKVALAWFNKDVSNAELNQVVVEEAYGMFFINLSHVLLRFPESSMTQEQIWAVLRECAAEFNLDIESTRYDQRPRKPNVVKGLATLSSDLVMDGLKTIRRSIVKN